MKTILTSNKVVAIDTDDTLIAWNLSEYPAEGQITVKYKKRSVTVYPMSKNINLLRKFAKLDYEIIVWSATGADWAATIVKALGLENEVTVCMTKPRYYFDDQKADEWMMKVYREEPKK